MRQHEYIETTCIGDNSLFARKLWNNWEIDEDRTTNNDYNASESINSALTAIIDQKNPDVYTFIEKIKLMQTETERILVQNIRKRVWKKSTV